MTNIDNIDNSDIKKIKDYTKHLNKRNLNMHGLAKILLQTGAKKSDLAEALGVSKATITGCYYGSRGMSVALARKIQLFAHEMGIDIGLDDILRD